MTVEESPQSPIGKLKEIYRTANKEHSNATLGQRAILATALSGLAFEWSTGNESMLGFVGARTHELTHNALATAVAGGGASFIEQGAIGTLMAMTIHNYPEVTAKLRELVSRGKEDSNTGIKRYASAMLLGTGVELAKENAVRPHDRSENIRHAMGSAAMISISNTAIIGSLSGLLKLGEEHGFEATSETIVNVASNPLTYVGLIGGIIGYDRLRKYVKKGKNKQRSELNLSEKIAEQKVQNHYEELLLEDGGMTVAVSDYISTEEHDTLWNMVETGFADLNRRSYEKQDMTKDELVSDLESDKVLKYVARDASSNPIGLLTVHRGLDAVTWTDTDELRKQQMGVDPDALPYYVGTIVVPVSERGTATAENLIRGALLHFRQTNNQRQENALVFFDCAEANYPWLPQFIQAVGSPSEQFPNLKTQVKELYVDAWVRGDGGVQKVHKASERFEDLVLDKQHHYSISINR